MPIIDTFFHRTPLLLWAASLVPLAACDPAIGPRHKGEEVAEIPAEVEGESGNDELEGGGEVEGGEIEGGGEVGGPEDVPLVDIVWLRCQQPDSDGCRIGNGRIASAGSIDRDGHTPEFEACMEACAQLPECASYPREDDFYGPMHCLEHAHCVEACGGFVESGEEFRMWGFSHDSQAESVEVAGDFPSNFSLKIYDAPDPSLLAWQGIAYFGIDNGPEVAIGVISAHSSGDVGLDSESGATGTWLGVAENQIVMYSDAAIEPWSHVGIYLELKETLPPGYHILDYRYEPCSPYFDDDDAGSYHCGHLAEVRPPGASNSIQLRFADMPSLQIPLSRKRVDEDIANAPD